jgi:hypothetical protein
VEAETHTNLRKEKSLMTVPAAAPVAVAAADGSVLRSDEEEKWSESEGCEEGEVEGSALRSLSDHLRKVSDSRSAHGRVYELHGVLCLVVVGLLTGRMGFSQIIALAVGHGARRRYNGAKRERMKRAGVVRPEPSAWLSDIGLLWRGDPTVPGLMQLIRILGGIAPADLQEAMRGWVSDLLETLGAKQYVGSVDGKAMRAGGKHVLSVFLHDVKQVILHEEVGEKKNELSTFREKLSGLLDRYPGLWLLCGDAMFADQTLCALLANRGRHWLFQIKANQANLFEKLAVFFYPITQGPPHVSDEPEKKGSMWKREITGWPTGASRC